MSERAELGVAPLEKARSQNVPSRGTYSEFRDSDDELQSFSRELHSDFSIGEFDPGSGRTLAACLTHASRTGLGATPG
jgi:hypothetical protein